MVHVDNFLLPVDSFMDKYLFLYSVYVFTILLHGKLDSLCFRPFQQIPSFLYANPNFNFT